MITILIYKSEELYTLLPLIRSLTYMNKKFNMICFSKSCYFNTLEIMKELKNCQYEVRLFSNLLFLHDKILRYLLTYIYESLTILLVSKNFKSTAYQRGIKTSNNKNRILFALSYRIPNKLKASIYELFLSFLKIISPLNKNSKKSDYLICSTPVKTIDICSFKGKIIYNTESWDHPFKKPITIEPNVFITWNKKQEKQYKFLNPILKNTKTKFINLGYPVKLNYLLDKINTYQPNIKNNKIIYIMSSSCSNSEIYHQEILLLKYFKDIIPKKYNLQVKIKPNSIQKELNDIKKLGLSVIEEEFDGYDSSCILKDAYNLNRLKSLYNCAFVINLCTTFAVEAALLGVPIIQIAPTSNILSKYAKWYLGNDHLKDVFFSDDKKWIEINNEVNLDKINLSKFINSNAPYLLSNHIRELFRPSINQEKSILELETIFSTMI